MDSAACLYYSVYFIHILVDLISHDGHNKNITVATMLECLSKVKVPIILIFMIFYKGKGLCAYLCNETKKKGG